MQSIVQSTYGTHDVLSLAERPEPEAGPKDLVIEVHASAISQGDRRLSTGDFPGITWLPGRLAMGVTGPRNAVQGTTFAGRVVATGAQVSGFVVGDEVFGMAPHGALTERIVMPCDGPVAHRPEGVSAVQASTLPYGAGTALTFLRDLAQVKPGDRVCILGASGGVGRFAVQLAKHLGAHVTGVSSAATHDLVRSLGADEVVDHRTQDFRDVAEPFDVVFDTVGASDFSSSRSALSANGRYLSLIVTVRLLWDMVVSRIAGGPQALTGVSLPGQADLRTLADLAEAGVFVPVIDQVLPMTQAAEAYARVSSGSSHGNVVLEGFMVAAASRPTLRVARQA